MAPTIGEVLSLWRARKISEARALCRTLLEQDPCNSDGLFFAGVLALHEKQHEEAIELLQRSVVATPHDPERRCSLGDAWFSAGRYAEAESSYHEAVAASPDWYLPYHRLGSTAMRTRQFERAKGFLEQCIARAPQYPHARTDLAMLLLRAGHCREGWRQYEWRWKTDGRPLHRRRTPVPLWDGTPLAGRTLLLWAEQGYGDVIQFARFTAMVPKDGGRILVHAVERLAMLLQSCPAIDGVLVDGDWCDADVQFPLLSVPGALDVPLERLGEPVPYLFSPDHAPAAEHVPRHDGTINAGLVWASSRPQFGTIERDCPVEFLLTLSDLPHVRLFGLQFGARAEDIAGDSRIRDLSPHLGDFHQTSAFVERMDVILTVDTSMAHLAGALGKRVWTMLSHQADWRWLDDRTSSPWYPTMTLYRQPATGDWPGVIAAIRNDLQRLEAQRPLRVQRPPARVSRKRVVFKQYGEMRTGTNLLRAIITKNYPGAIVLMHVLGDKHSPPAAFASLWDETRSAEEPDAAFAERATFEVPSLTTTAKDTAQVQTVRRLAKAIARAWEVRELGFLVSIKDPYAWACSIARFRGWALDDPDTLARLEEACRRFSERYASWLELEQLGTTFIARHEDLLSDAPAVLRRLEERFALPCAAAPRIPTAPVEPAGWDHTPIRLTSQTFDALHYRERRYLDSLPRGLRDLVTRTIDWKLMDRFGYAPVETTTFEGGLRHAI